MTRTHGSLARDRRRRQRRAVRVPAPRHPARREAARSARSSRPRTPQIGTGAKVPHLSLRRRRRRSGKAPTSAPGRSSPTTTASTKRTTDGRRHSFVGSNSVLVAPGAHRRRRLRRRRARRSPATCGPGELGVGRGPQRNIPAGCLRKRAGTKTAAAARGAAAEPCEDGRRIGGDDDRRSDREQGISHDRSRMTGVKKPNEKHLMLFSGRAYPELAEEVAELLGVELVPTTGAELRQLRDLRPVRGVGPRLRRVRHPVPRGAGQRVGDGAADHGRRPQAGLGQADHRRRAVLPVRPAGQEAPRPRADLGPAHRRPVPGRRRRPDHVGRPARRPDPGLLRRAGGPPVRDAGAADYVEAPSTTPPR